MIPLWFTHDYVLGRKLGSPVLVKTKKGKTIGCGGIAEYTSQKSCGYIWIKAYLFMNIGAGMGLRENNHMSWVTGNCGLYSAISPKLFCCFYTPWFVHVELLRYLPSFLLLPHIYKHLLLAKQPLGLWKCPSPEACRKIRNSNVTCGAQRGAAFKKRVITDQYPDCFLQ